MIYNFSGGKGGAEPIKVAQGSDGLLYGITFNDGKAYSGTVFVIATNGNRFKILQSLGTRTSIGDHPTDLLVDGAGTNLALYGVTQSGGQTDAGILFRLTPERGKYAVLSQFDLYGADGVEPNTPLCQGADGMLYGTTLIGGTRNLGTIFRMNTNGSGYQVLWHFAGGRNGSNPVGVVVNSANGSVFGTTAGFYTPGGEIVFRLNTNGTFLAIHHFTGTNDGAAPNPLLLGSDGFLYGTAFEAGPLGGGSVFRMRMNGSSFMVLHSFPLQTSPQKGGSYPAASLIEGPNGALYGTTTYGGSNNAGTIFTLHKDGSNFKLIHHFTMADGGPMAPLLAASDGKLYGSATFYAGVDTNTYFAYSVGSIFRINPDGSQYEELHTFSVYTNDVYAPVGPLIEGNDSAIYGAARFSGVSPSGPEPGGLYKMNNDGSGFQVLHIFVSDPNGSNPLGTYPRSGLLKTSDGGIFGTTDWGGDMGAGTVFQYVPDP